MPWQDVPGHKGTRWRPLEETLADPDYELYRDAEGNVVDARKKPGWFTKALPYMVGGTMAGGLLANAGIFAGLGGSAASTGGGSTAAAMAPEFVYSSAAIPAGGVASGMSGAAAGGSGMGGIGGFLSKVGGWLNRASPILDAANKIAPVLGKAAEGRAEGRMTEEQFNIYRDRLNQDAARDNAQAPRRRMGDMTRANAMAAGPVSASWGGPGSGLKGQTVKFTGGFNERDPRMKQLADLVMDQQINNQLTGADHTPGATPAIQPGVIDKTLGIGATTGGILGAVNEILRQRRASRPGVPAPGGQAQPYATPTQPAYMNEDLLGNVVFGPR